jgi:hypothetical protein
VDHVSYTEPAGDVGRPPDIKNEGVSDAVGRLTFTFRVSNLTPLIGSTDDAWVVTDLDTNRNGNSNYYFYFGQDLSGPYFDLMKTGDDNHEDSSVPQSPSMQMYSAGETTS